MHHWLCRLGWHKWKPTYRPWPDADDLWRALFGFAEWTGHVCTRCRKRRGKPEGGPQAGDYD